MGDFGPKWGRCRLCGEEGELTLAHTPPAKAYNTGRYQPGSIIDQLRGIERPPAALLQGGIRDYRLCGVHNSFCGDAYEGDYIKFAWGVMPYVVQAPAGPCMVTVVEKIRPLRVLKAALAALIASMPPGFLDNKPELQSFILDKERMHLPPRYDVYLTLVRRGRSRLSGIYGHCDTSIFHGGDFEVACELAHPPFGWVMTLDSPRANDGGRVSHFGAYSYNKRADHLRFPCLIGETASPTPGDYRTDEQLRAARPTADARS